MALGEIARDLQKTASNELLWLREMRQYVNTWTPERRSAEWEKLIAFEESAKMLGRAAASGSGCNSRIAAEPLLASNSRSEPHGRAKPCYTMEGLQRFCLMIAEAGKKDRLAELYRKVLHCAEVAERRQKGGGEDFIKRARPVIMERLEKIEARYREEKEYQLRIKEGTADGESGSEATAAAGGGGGKCGGTAESQK